jgi:hypothetical protein
MARWSCLVCELLSVTSSVAVGEWERVTVDWMMQ